VPYVAERYVGVTLPALLAIPRRFAVADEKYAGHGVANFIPSIDRRFEGRSVLRRNKPIVERRAASYDVRCSIFPNGG
jgi:hypothetical protein